MGISLAWWKCKSAMVALKFVIQFYIFNETHCMITNFHEFDCSTSKKIIWTQDSTYAIDLSVKMCDGISLLGMSILRSVDNTTQHILLSIEFSISNDFLLQILNNMSSSTWWHQEFHVAAVVSWIGLRWVCCSRRRHSCGWCAVAKHCCSTELFHHAYEFSAVCVRKLEAGGRMGGDGCVK